MTAMGTQRPLATRSILNITDCNKRSLCPTQRTCHFGHKLMPVSPACQTSERVAVNMLEAASLTDLQVPEVIR